MRVSTSSYEPLAAEYYEDRHITSRNFDAATLAFLRSHRPRLSDKGLVLELGAGRGGSAKYLGVHGERIVQCDISPSMLRIMPREACLGRIRADALDLPIRSESVAIVAAFLYDPYNRPALYNEIGRVLGNHGVFVGTIPHPAWGSAVRRLRGHETTQARFLTRAGTTLERDSFLLTDAAIRRLMRASGLEMIGGNDVLLPRNVQRISPDILAPAEALGVDPHELPIIKLVTARKIG